LTLINGKAQDAIAIFKANVEEYPRSAGAYDSLGEGYSDSGQRELAIERYHHALKLDPHDQTQPKPFGNLTISPKKISQCDSN
jgi:tetratricopeptide (TPR) repeat protein